MFTSVGTRLTGSAARRPLLASVRRSAASTGGNPSALASSSRLTLTSPTSSPTPQPHRRPFTRSAVPCLAERHDQRDPGGKPIPTDGSYRTVYDDFNNILAHDAPMLSVHSMGESNFTLSDGLVCRTPIVLLQNNVFLWDAPALGDPNQPDPAKQLIMPNGKGWEAWTDDVWRIIEVASPRPEIVIFGTGKTVCPPPASVRTFLNGLGVQVEAHNTRNACSTYNMLAEEGRLVAAALLPNVRQPVQRIKITEQARKTDT